MLQQITRQTRDKYQEKLRTNNEVPHLSKSQKSRRYGAFCLSVRLSGQFHWCPRGSDVLIIIRAKQIDWLEDERLWAILRKLHSRSNIDVSTDYAALNETYRQFNAIAREEIVELAGWDSRAP